MARPALTPCTRSRSSQQLLDGLHVVGGQLRDALDLGAVLPDQDGGHRLDVEVCARHLVLGDVDAVGIGRVRVLLGVFDDGRRDDALVGVDEDVAVLGGQGGVEVVLAGGGLELVQCGLLRWRGMAGVRWMPIGWTSYSCESKLKIGWWVGVAVKGGGRGAKGGCTC